MFYGVIQEGYVFDNKDIRYNVEEFEQGKVKTLFITGHSGSGKSTLGHKYSEDLKIPCYELDNVLLNHRYKNIEDMKKDGPDLYEFFTGEGARFRLEKNPKDPETGKKALPFSPLMCIKSFIEFILKKNARCVVEGCHIYVLLYENVINLDMLKNSAIIIKGTSGIKSVYRSVKRDYLKDKEEDPNIKITDALTFDYLKNKLNYMFKDEKVIKEIRKQVNKLKEG
jgi:energy-coupling factor transporter ATP-binding protein EcfA2